MSNIVPNKETLGAPENKAEIRNAKTIPKPASKHADLGKTILPSTNLATTQKIIEKDRPTTKSKPLEVSMGMEVRGKKKTGNNTITKNNDKKEIRSKIFDNILKLYIY